MISADDIKAAFDALLEADEEMYKAEEARIEAAQAREKAYLAAVEEAISDGVADPARQQQRANKATRKQLTVLHQKEKAARAAQHKFRRAGMAVDSLKTQLEAEKLAKMG